MNIRSATLLFIALCSILPYYARAQATAEEILAEHDVRALETEWENSDQRYKQLEVTNGELQKQQIILVRDKETGLIESKDTKNTRHRFAVAQHFHSNTKKLFDIKTFDLNYGYNFKEHLWVEAFLATTNAKFESISEPNANRSQDIDALNDTTETLLTMGVGLGLTTTFLRDFINFQNLFETYSAYVGVGRLREDFNSETFTGPGLRADWGVNLRWAENIHLGLKFSWNHYSVKRAEIFTDEPQRARHLSISWLSLGVEGGIHF